MSKEYTHNKKPDLFLPLRKRLDLLENSKDNEYFGEDQINSLINQMNEGFAEYLSYYKKDLIIQEIKSIIEKIKYLQGIELESYANLISRINEDPPANKQLDPIVVLPGALREELDQYLEFLIARLSSYDLREDKVQKEERHETYPGFKWLTGEQNLKHLFTVLKEEKAIEDSLPFKDFERAYSGELCTEPSKIKWLVKNPKNKNVTSAPSLIGLHQQLMDLEQIHKKPLDVVFVKRLFFFFSKADGLAFSDPSGKLHNYEEAKNLNPHVEAILEKFKDLIK